MPPLANERSSSGARLASSVTTTTRASGRIVRSSSGSTVAARSTSDATAPGAPLDVEGGTGQLRKSDLSSRGIIESVEVHFEHGPFLFLQEDFAADPVRFVSDLDAFVAAQTPVLEELNLAPRNAVGHYQARLLCWLNGLTRFWHNPHGLLLHSNPYTIFLRVEPRRVCQGWVDFLSRRPVRLPEEDQEAILEQYREDRAFVEDYSQKGQWV